MRAAVVAEVGSPPEPADFDEPIREDGTALVTVHAAPLNPVEIRVAAGRHARRAEPPYVPGLEGGGTVVESEQLAPGTRVRFEGSALPGFGAQGTLAERAAVPEESLVELPEEVDVDVAAALGVVGITALLALERAAPTAVGQMAVQLARVMGAGRIVGAGRSAEGLERVRGLGADEVVELSDGELTDSFDRAAGGELDIVIDPLWGDPAMAALRTLATEGRLVNVGQSAGADARLPLENVRNRQGAIHAVSSGWTPLERKAAVYRRLLEHVEAGRVTVDRDVVPLEEVAAAWRRQDASPGRKLVISIGGVS
jgi:NADPH:quinone reductase